MRREKTRFYLVLTKIQFKKIWLSQRFFIKKNIRNISYHQFYLVLPKIQIYRIQINRGLLYFIF